MVTVTPFTEAGGHPDNEDAFVVCRHPSNPDCWLCFLADGQEGAPAGRKLPVSPAALRQTLRSTNRRALWQNRKCGTALLQQADQAVLADSEAGYTTLLGFVIAGGSVIGASSGDSAVIALSQGNPARDLTKRQFKNPPVGSGDAIFVSFSVSLNAPWSVLAMSDGVWKYVAWERLVAAAGAYRGERLVEALQDLARLPRSGQFQDDFTLVAIEARG